MMPSTAASSDYGSDFGDEGNNAQLIVLLDAIEARHAQLVSSSYVLEDISNHDRPSVVKLPRSSPLENTMADQQDTHDQVQDDLSVGHHSVGAVQHSERDQVPHDGSPGKISFQDARVDATDASDERSPLERFRTAPKKPLSVTDLVSPAWCELQYWYVLTKHGKKRRTPAMKQGSAVHKTLEDQVHQTVPVDVQTREDHWGLRIWNIIQGLRTLKATGRTRELEIWGVIDGQVVNGIIDEVSFTCPDPDMEATLIKAESKTTKDDPAPDQTTIAEFFASQKNTEAVSQARNSRKKRVTATSTPSLVYITDVKTRMNANLPNSISLRPTITQLMLYRKMLAEMASNNVDSQTLFSRYQLDSAQMFSDTLLAQLASLDFNSQDNVEESQDNALEELLNHNNLTALWGLMIEEFQKVLHQGANSISKVLAAEFRSQADGSIIGVKTFPYKEEDLQRYIHDEMMWWTGQREARGVEVEEAFKCRSCEFAEDCTWRLNKIEAAIRASRSRNPAG